MRITMHAYWKKYSWEEKPNLYLYDHAGISDGYLYAGAHEIDIPIEPPSHADLVKAQVAELRKEQGELIHQADLIEEKIQKLMAIEHKPVVV